MSHPDPTYLLNADPAALENLYQQYTADKESVDFGWRKFFEGFDLGAHKFETSGGVSENAQKEISVLNLINAYRQRGHLFAKTNPLRERRQYTPTLDIENFGLQTADLETVFQAGTQVGLGPATLKDIVALLQQTYCQSIGCEFSYIRDPRRREWLQTRFEKTRNNPDLTVDEKRHFLKKLNQATVFENFIHTKYIGQKRFSVEGLECLIPALDAVIQYGAGLGVEEFVMGMAHRGRLNVLANVFNKKYSDIFGEFEGKVFQNEVDEDFEGDVKYHLGYSTDVDTASGKKVHLRLADNPSHLEAVNPVVKGLVRAKLDSKYAGDVRRICPILIHGDAAVAGQGIIYEVVQMSGLEGYYVGGCIHVVTNNQIGFTTNYQDARTSTYCTDVAKVTLCPVLHVNGDDVEAVIHAVKLAMAYRLEFNSDIFIDLLGYRKYGHNEGDEPRFTQPVMYKLIDKHPNIREIYKEKLLNRGEIDAELAREMEVQFKELLQEKFEEAKGDYKPSPASGAGLWEGFQHPGIKDFENPTQTAVAWEKLQSLGQAVTHIPEDNQPIKKVQNLFADRRKMLETGKLDWAMGELLAYATLLDEGHPVRLAGQDVERGTFSHRHAVVKKEDSEQEYIPLQHLRDGQARFSVYNSLLSEYAALGYEYGYSSSTPNGLTLWEAQFGDFANGAQIIFDQFLSSAEAKWGKFSGLTLLLPHGYEGQGPEHSSARPERYLQLCAGGNMQVMNISTPANLFHALRRQLKRNFQVPLIIMSPKSLLRHPKCISSPEEFSEAQFQELIDDRNTTGKVRRVLFCTGKVYYDLLAEKEKDNHTDVAIVRIEQLYPLPEWTLKNIFEKYSGAEFCWVQEEPRNQGYWLHLARYDFPVNLRYIGRKTSASPATGFKKVHDREQQEIVQQSFA
ncbi:MAG: 2-oxoglutarate dehydrogenase E1 component [Bacteroidetes bacterium]|nr:2-oxoglutarate dehydrogenase E1 component [Bacteroidota bacterium]